MLSTDPQNPDPLDLQIFESLPGNFLLISSSFHLIGMSSDYLYSKDKDRETLRGKYLFDILPEVSHWSFEQNVSLEESLDRVLQTGNSDELNGIRINRLEQGNYWKCINKPVLDIEGRVKYIIHQLVEAASEYPKEKQSSDFSIAKPKSVLRTGLQAEQMEKLFHDIPAQIAVVRGPDYVYDYINPQYQRELFPGRQVLGLPLLVALPEIEGQPILDILQTVYTSGKPHIQNEMRIPVAPKHGAAMEDHYFNLVYQPLFNHHGEVYAILSFKYEITSHVLARQTLEIATKDLTIANNDLNTALIELQALHEELQSSSEELVSSNEQLVQIQEQLNTLNKDLEVRIADRTRELAESFEEQQALNEEISASNEEMTAANEELTAINEELSETQQLLQETLKGLSESEQRFRNLVRDATVGIILLTEPKLKVSIVNTAYGKLIGRSAEELEGRPLFDIIPEAEGVFRPLIEKVWESGESINLYDQPYVVYKNGSAIEGHLNLIYQPYREANGSISGVMVLCQDVSIQMAARLELEKSEERFKFLLNAIPQQVWTATPDGELDYVNQVVSVDFGHTPESVVGQGWKEFVHPEDLAGALEKWVKALQSGREYLTEFRLKFEDGNYYWHLARALPMVESGKITLWLGTNTNIDAKKNQEYQKDEFLSIASHELKTPLTTIKAFFQLTKRDAGEHKILNQFAGMAERQLERLGRLIEDLLDVSKINAGKMVYNMEDFDFAQALSDTVNSIQQTSSRHKIEIVKNCSVIYHGDRHRLEQVLINILNNAIKYSPNADQILVGCDIEKQNLIVFVQDFGIGIAKEHLKSLFDRFYRVDNSSARFQGLGLGLFISAEIVKRHGGSFWIESEPDTGSTFYFLLPLSGKQEFRDIAGDGERFYEGDFVTIHYIPEGMYLNVNWKGYQNYESVVKGCEIILDLMQKNKCRLVLNDNTEVKGNWSEASDWVAEVWFPAMAQAGLQKFAWVYSPSTFSRIAADVSLPSVYEPVAFFNDKDAARRWLLSS